jgi:uncharacterized protein (DUF4415 family)
MSQAKQKARVKRVRKGVSLQAAAGSEKLPKSALRELMNRYGSEYFRPIKKPITLRLDADVRAWFKRKGSGYQTRINRALREVMRNEKEAQ